MLVYSFIPRRQLDIHRVIIVYKSNVASPLCLVVSVHVFNLDTAITSGKSIAVIEIITRGRSLLQVEAEAVSVDALEATKL